MAALALLAFGAPRAFSADPSTVCFYSSETSVNNFRLLKEEFDSYLTRLGPYLFQPFSQVETFETFVRDKKSSCSMVSSWHFKNLRERVALEPVLVGRLRDRTMQRRVLAVDKSITSASLLKGEKIASASTEDYTRTLLRELLHEAIGADVASISVLKVPKDIDALMAVSFKMARAALTTESSLANLSQINPKQFSQLHVLATSRETLLPIVAVPSQPESQVEALVQILEQMSAQPDGQRLVKMLGVDGLQRLNAAEKNLLSP
ncbi:MAG: PhnD/SsuA/transferrin family substrate-binding protein [Verrucomicrobiota bacterium]